MAVDEKANVAYVEQLREMRAQRMMQLRQGNDQKQQFSLMTRALNSVAAATNTQTRVATQNLREQQAVVRQTKELSRDFKNLSVSITKSIGGLTAALGRGVGGVAGAAGRGVVATASTATNISSSILSVLGRILPVALAGIIGKAFIWDNLTSETKNRLTSALGKMFLNVFESLKPVFAKLGDTIKSLFQSIGVELGAVFDGIKAVSSKAVGDISSSLSEALAPFKKTMRTVSDTVGTAQRFGEKIGIGNVNIGDIVTGAGVVAAGVGLNKLMKGGVTPKGISGPVIVVTEDIKKMYDILARNGLSDKPGNLVGARLIVEAERKGGSKAANFLRFVYDYKIANIMGVIIPAAMYLWEVSEVEEVLARMESENLITSQEKAYFLSLGKTIAATSATGSFLLSALAMYATKGKGGVARAGSGMAGGAAGNLIGEYLGKPLHKIQEFMGMAPERPSSLDRETLTGGGIKNQLYDLEDNRNINGAPQASGVVPNGPTGSSGSVDPDIQKIINRGEREGIRQNPYQSAEGGYPTIGIGHKLTKAEFEAGGVFINGKLVPLDLSNVKPPGLSEQGPKQLTKEQVMKLYEQDHKKHTENARDFIGADVFDKLNKDQQLALGDMSFMNPASLTPELRNMVRSGNTQGVAKYMENWGKYYTKDGKQEYSEHLISAARGRAKLYAGPGGYSEGLIDRVGAGASDYSKTFMQAYSASREQGYAALESERNQETKAEGSKMKFFSSGMVESLVGAFKDGSELKSNIVGDLRNMANMLGGPATKQEEKPQKNIVTNFNTTNINNNNIGGGGGGVSTNGVRAKDDLVTDFLKMSGT
jgi:hypothetical protein